MRLQRKDSPRRGDHVGPAVPRSRRPHIGGIVAGSLFTGLVAAALLPFVPADTVDADFATAMVLFGFAFGWALMAVLSIRFTEQPQRWAVAPAIFMALSGALVLLAPDAVVDTLGWVWPPALLVLVVWVWARARRDLHSRTRVWLLCPVLLVLVLVALGGGYETISDATAPAVAMRGRLVDVGPYRLHLECIGSRGPTVILRAWRGRPQASMGLIAPAVARDSRVCIYDRAGRAWSDPAASPPDGAQIAKDLHKLLDRAHVPGPYVLAGHSFGGLHAGRRQASRGGRRARPGRLHRRRRPARVPSEGRFLQRSEAPVHAGRDDLTAGLGRLLANTSFSDLPPRYRDDARVTSATAKELSGVIDEYSVAGRSAPAAGRLRSFDAKPLIVLTATRGNRKGWVADQNEMVKLSTNSLHRFEQGAAHASFVDDPDHADAVVTAIQDVVASVRTGEPLQRP